MTDQTVKPKLETDDSQTTTNEDASTVLFDDWLESAHTPEKSESPTETSTGEDTSTAATSEATPATETAGDQTASSAPVDAGDSGESPADQSTIELQRLLDDALGRTNPDRSKFDPNTAEVPPAPDVVLESGSPVADILTGFEIQDDLTGADVPPSEIPKAEPFADRPEELARLEAEAKGGDSQAAEKAIQTLVEAFDDPAQKLKDLGLDVKQNGDGTLSVKGAQGGVEYTIAQGENGHFLSSVENGDSSRKSFNEQGKLKETKGPDGSVFKFGYDETGALNQVTYPDGAVWSSENGSDWSRVERPTAEREEGETSAPEPRKTFEGTMAVTEDGEFSWETASRKTKYERDLDGSSTLSKFDDSGELTERTHNGADRTSVTRDGDEHVLKTRDAKGTEREFKYFEDGENSGALREFKEGEDTWTTTDGKSWTNQSGDSRSFEATVGEDGSLKIVEGGVTTTRNLDGTSKVEEKDGSYKVLDGKNITETRDTKGNVRHFEYDPSGELSRYTMESGEVFTRGPNDGSVQNWTSSEGRHDRYRSIEVRDDGTLAIETSGQNRKFYKPDGTQEVVRLDETKQAATELREAMGMNYSQANSGKIFSTLEGMTAEQRQYLGETFQSTYGRSIDQMFDSKLSGAELERARVLLHRPDGAAGDLAVTLSETNPETRNQVLLDSLKQMSPEELKETDRDYRERYGEGFIDAAMRSDGITDETKDSIRQLDFYKENYTISPEQMTALSADPEGALEAGGKELTEKLGRIALSGETVQSEFAVKLLSRSPEGIEQLKASGLKVSENGDGTQSIVNERTQTKYTVGSGDDGTYLQKIERPDRTSTGFDQAGNIVEAVRADGVKVTVERNADSQITSIRESTGRQWTSEDGSTFKLVGDDATTINGTASINNDGTFRFDTENGALEVGRDGDLNFFDESNTLRMKAGDDGSLVSYDEQGRVTLTKDALGRQRGFTYEGESRVPVGITEPDGSSWISTDGENWRRDGSDETRRGKVEVGSDGSYTVTTASGESHTFNTDGSSVARDKDHRVVQMTNANGQDYKFKYDDQGELVEVHEKGNVWTTRDGSTWTNDKGTTWKGTFEVNEDGSLTERNAEGNHTRTHRTDGWREIINKDNKRYTVKDVGDEGSRVWRNERGQVYSVTHADNTSTTIGFNDDGTPTSLKMRDGSTLTSEDGRTWTDPRTGEKTEFSPEIGTNGFLRKSFADGSVRLENFDGSSMRVDSSTNRILETTDAKGKSIKYSYGENGEISGLERSDGSVWSTQDNQHWTQTQRPTSERAPGETSAPEPQATMEGIARVAPDGTHSFESLDGSSKTVEKLDGTEIDYKEGKLQQVVGADGTVTQYKYDDAGKPSAIEVKSPDGSALTYNAEGQIVKTKPVRGNTREFEYFTEGELKGQLRKLTIGDKSWSTTDGQNWVDSNGRHSFDRGWVAENGEFSYLDDGEIKTLQNDGNTRYTQGDGSYRIENSKHQILETKDVDGDVRKFEYNTSGSLVKMTVDGKTWTRESSNSSGYLWRSEDGTTNRYKSAEVLPDGTLFTQDSHGDRKYHKPSGAVERIDYDRMLAAVKSIRDASNRDDLIDTGTEESKFNQALEGKTSREREYMNELYKEKYGHDIEAEARHEMEGSDLEKALALLQKPDGADEAGTVRVALTEMDQWFVGNSDWENERIIRDTIETMSAADIARVNEQYRERYGTDMISAILNNDEVSQKTKDAVRILQHGHDRRTEDQTKQLAELAIKHSDPNMFQEAMRRAPKSLRDHYSSGEGAQKLKDAFEGHWYHALTFGLSGNVSNINLRHVQDYAEYGKLSVASQTLDNTSWLGDNEQAIEHALTNMSAEERQSYRIGRFMEKGGFQTQEDKDAFGKMSAADREKAREYYKTTFGALEGAAGVWFSGSSQTNELMKWEDMAMNPGGTLVSKLADHRGMVYDDSMQDVISDVENMSEADWARLKSDPTYRDRLQGVLSTYLSSSELDRTMKIVDGKMDAETFDESKSVRRPILEVISDNAGITVDEDKIYQALENMSAEELAKYRENGGDNDFRRTLDRRLRMNLDFNERKVPEAMLKRFLDGTDERPTMTLIEKMNVQASYFDADEAQIIRDIDDAFKADPTMRDRINNPQTDEDREFSRQFKDAARRAMGSGDYEKYAAPLIATGELSIELRQELNNGIFDDDEQGSYRDMTRVTSTEASRLRTDPAFRARVLGHLSEDEQEVALNTMEQGEMRPEDKLRSYMIGAGTSEQEIRDVFSELRDRNKPEYQGLSTDQVDAKIQERLAEVSAEYARKYGEDLGGRLIDELGGKDLRQVQRMMIQRGSREEFLFAQQQAANTRSGFGSWLNDSIWDGTGFQMDNDRSELARQMVMDPDSVHEYADRLYKSIDMHAESKEALANAIVDTTIAAAAIAGAAFTGGVSLSLIAYTGLLGAGFKLGTKSLVMGGDYDFSSMALADLASGGFEGGTTFVGLGMFKAGGAAGLKAAQETIEAAGKTLVREGTEAAFKQEVRALVVNGLKDQAKGITDDAIKQLAQKYGAEGMEEALQQALKQNLDSAVKEVGEQWLRGLARDAANGWVDGTFGAGGSGLIMGATQAKDLNEFTTIAATSTMFGGLGGGTMGGAIRPIGWGVGKVWNGAGRILGRTGDDVGENISEVTARNAGDVKVGDDAAPRVDVDETAPRVDGDDTAPRVDGDETPPKVDGDDVPPQADDGNPTRNEGDDAEPNGDEDLDQRHRDRVDEGDEPTAKPDETPELMTPAELKTFSDRIASKFSDQPVSEQQFRDLFEGDYEIDGVTRKLTLEEKKVVAEILEQSGPNMNSAQLNARMKSVREAAESIDGWKWGNSQRRGGPEVATVFVLDGASDANALSHLFRVNAGLDVNVRVLSGKELTDLNKAAETISRMQREIDDLGRQVAENPDAMYRPGRKASDQIKTLEAQVKKLKVDNNLENVIVFDNLANATPEQRMVLSQIDRLAVADMDGFTRGPNLYDMASAGLSGDNGVVRDKIQDLIGDITRTQRESGLSLRDATDRVLQGRYADDVARDFPNAHVHNTDAELPGRAARDTTDGASENLQASLFSETFKPRTTSEDIQAILGRLSADQQRLAAGLLEGGLHNHSYTDMMRQARELHENLLATVPDGKPENLLIVTGLETGGSAYMSNSLYARANGLGPDNFVSLNDLRALARVKPGADVPLDLQPIVDKLKGKRLAFIDDYSMSGTQMVSLLDQNYDTLLRAQTTLQRFDSGVDGMSVGTFGRYEGDTLPNPWLDFNTYPNVLGNGTDPPKFPVALVDSPSVFKPLTETDWYNNLPPAEQDKALGWLLERSQYKNSSVRSALATPYGGPNNNILWIQAFLEHPDGLGLPTRIQGDWTEVLSGRATQPTYLNDR